MNNYKIVRTQNMVLQRRYDFILVVNHKIFLFSNYRTLLWDIRKSQGHPEGPEPVAELEVKHNTVKFLHMDPYKIVTGGPFDYRVQVWETGTGFLANSLDCRPDTREVAGLTAMVVDQCRIVTSGCSDYPEFVCYRDFSGCSLPVSLEDLGAAGSKFWESTPLSD